MTTKDVTEDQSDTAVVEVELETVAEKVMNEFDSVASITIGHLASYKMPSNIRITVHTKEADSFEDYIQLFTPDHKIVIDREEEKIQAPFIVMATFDGPGTYDTVGGTTIYMNENVIGAEPIQLEDGLAYLRTKLESPDQWSNDHRFQADRIRNYSE